MFGKKKTRKFKNSRIAKEEVLDDIVTLEKEIKSLGADPKNTNKDKFGLLQDTLMAVVRTEQEGRYSSKYYGLSADKWNFNSKKRKDGAFKSQKQVAESSEAINRYILLSLVRIFYDVNMQKDRAKMLYFVEKKIDDYISNPKENPLPELRMNTLFR